MEENMFMTCTWAILKVFRNIIFVETLCSVLLALETHPLPRSTYASKMKARPDLLVIIKVYLKNGFKIFSFG